MLKNQNNKDVVTGLDLYVTRSGRIAFLEAVNERDMGTKAFSGYVYSRARGRNVVRSLEWLACGKCVSSNDDGDEIVRRA